MLKIRLARSGKHKSPFYRIVLTEHTKPAQSGYSEVLGWFDPINHKSEINVAKSTELIKKGAIPSSRVAKMLFNETKDAMFKKYYNEVERTRVSKKKAE